MSRLFLLLVNLKSRQSVGIEVFMSIENNSFYIFLMMSPALYSNQFKYLISSLSSKVETFLVSSSEQ